EEAAAQRRPGDMEQKGLPATAGLGSGGGGPAPSSGRDRRAGPTRSSKRRKRTIRRALPRFPGGVRPTNTTFVWRPAPPGTTAEQGRPAQRRDEPGRSGEPWPVAGGDRDQQYMDGLRARRDMDVAPREKRYPPATGHGVPPKPKPLTPGLQIPGTNPDKGSTE